MANRVPVRENTILGLDLGTRSVGWALLLRDEHRKFSLLRAGVRHFDAGSLNVGKGKGDKGEVSNTSERTGHRGQRRQTRRTAGRKAKLYRILADAGMLPAPNLPTLDELEEETSTAYKRRVENQERKARIEALRNLDRNLWGKVKSGDLGDHGDTLPFLPFVLRSNGLDRRLEPMEFGRALYHLAQHRGFFSHRHADDELEVEKKSSKKGGGKFADALKTYEQREGTSDKHDRPQRTVGEIQYRMIQNNETTENHGRQVTVRRQGEPAWRGMYEREFDALWDAQVQYGGSYLEQDIEVRYRRSKRGGGDPDKVLSKTLPLREVVKKAIFHQRPLKSAAHLVGACDLENGVNWLRQEGSRTRPARRLPWAHPLSQRFRMLAMVNNVKIKDANGEPVRLSKEQRQTLFESLSGRSERMRFSEAKSALGLKENDKFNFEHESSSSEKSFEVLKTETLFRSAFGSRWHEMSDDEKERVFHDWYNIKNKNALRFRFATHWELGVTGAAKTTLTARALGREIADRKRSATEPNQHYGYRQAEEEFGTIKYSEAVETIANANLDPGHSNLSKRAIQRLLPLMANESNPLTYGEAKNFLYEKPSGKPFDRLPPLDRIVPELNSPIVRRALSETRKVVDDLIEEEGYKPGKIHVEVTRNLRVGKQARKDADDERELNRKANQNAATMAREMGLENKRGQPLVKIVKLAQECGWCCPYTGKSFGADDIRKRHVEIEHIIPRSMLPGDSFGNLTLSYRKANGDKRDKPPHAAFSNSPGDYNWDEILMRVARFKRRSKYAQTTKILKAGLKGKSESSRDRHPKYKLFLLRGTRQTPSAELEEHVQRFTFADLNQTAWMTKTACGYLASLYGVPASAPHLRDSGGEGKRRIYAVSGKVTGFLRRVLGKYVDQNDLESPHDKYWRDLNSILRPTQEFALPNEDLGFKKSRADHRHHAIDAIVVAMAHPKLVSRISEASGSDETKRQYVIARRTALKSWPSVYDDIRSAMYGGVDSNGVKWRELIVSERPMRRLQGELHKATLKKKGKSKITIGECESVRERWVTNSSIPFMLVYKRRGKLNGRTVSLIEALECRRHELPFSSLLQPEEEFQYVLWASSPVLLTNEALHADGPIDSDIVYYVRGFEGKATLSASPHWWGANWDRNHPASVRQAFSSVASKLKLRRIFVTPTGKIRNIGGATD